MVIVLADKCNTLDVAVFVVVATEGEEPGAPSSGRAAQHPGERGAGGGAAGLADRRPGAAVHQGARPHPGRSQGGGGPLQGAPGKARHRQGK